MLITSPEFTSNLTRKTYYINSFDPLDCSTKNVIYAIECTLCGLLYVGETRQALRSRMSQFRGTHISFATLFRVVANEDLVNPGDVLD
jgi:hypothetical protein